MSFIDAIKAVPGPVWIVGFGNYAIGLGAGVLIGWVLWGGAL